MFRVKATACIVRSSCACGSTTNLAMLMKMKHQEHNQPLGLERLLLPSGNAGQRLLDEDGKLPGKLIFDDNVSQFTYTAMFNLKMALDHLFCGS